MSTLTAPPTGTVTFLFTDIEGSTKLWEQHPDAMRPALARHDVLLRQAIENHDGYIFKTVGDAFCAAFPDACRALHAALAAQTALGAEAWELPAPLLVRMALHTGSAEERDGDYFGPPLNRVARLMAAGHGGQTLLCGETHARTYDLLPAGAALRDLGQRRLKDLGRPEQIFQLLHPDLATDFPPLRSLDNPELPNNLPQQTSSFIGREKESAVLRDLLSKTRLLTLTGAGGSGKSRLSVHVAADLLDRYFDGVWLVELAAISDPVLVPQAVANVLGVREAAGQTITQALVDWLKPKRLLLILDNCEHLVAACADLAAAVLRDCPGVYLLTSSREALNVPGEQTYRVPTLSLPDLTRTQTAAAVSQFESVRLFTERAQAVQVSFAVTSANAAAVAQVCTRLDGIPLAIELAAARVRSLPIEQINARLDDRFRLLTGGSRTALPRQQTLRALVDWSYDLLTADEQTLLRRLSVFAGGWTLAAAETVCSGDGIEEFAVLDLLTSLVDKSLVIYDSERDGDRYRFLETVRRYASDRLLEDREAETVQGQAASWFLALAEDAERQLKGPDQAAWLSRLEAEHDNLRASLAWFEQALSDAENCLRLAGSLWHFWMVRGHLSEGRTWLNRALKKSEDSPEVVPLMASLTHAKALEGAGGLALAQSSLAEARVFFEACLLIYQQSGMEAQIASQFAHLGHLAQMQGDLVEAVAFLEESLTIFRRLKDPHIIAALLGNLGAVAQEKGDFTEARTCYEESLTVFRRLGDQRYIAVLLTNLAIMARDQGSLAQAQAMIEESLALQRHLVYS